MDHATAERLVALPDISTVHIYDRRINVPGTAWFTSRVFFPKEAVLAKTISMEFERGKPSSKRHLETQILHFDGDNWFGYTYRWNDAQTDAELVPASGAERELDILDPDVPGGHRKQTWHFPSRGQCLICHNGWAGPVLGFSPEQLNRQGQIESLQKLNAVALAVGTGKGAPKTPAGGKIRVGFQLADPYDAKQDLARRARSYLDINCAHCHQNGAGGTATIDLRAEVALGATKANDVPPIQGTFNIDDARLLAPGDPYRSVLYYRMSKTGPGRMPHIGSDIVDSAGIEAVHEWIRSLPHKGEVDSYDEAGVALDALRVSQGEDLKNDPALVLLLSSTPRALFLARALDKKLLPAALAPAIAAVATTVPEGEIRDLFERFLPAELRAKRLGTAIAPEAVLSLKGDPQRGKQVFFKTAGLQCAVCHKIGNEGGLVGPDLSLIGKKLDRAKILENILDPSKEIEPAYIIVTRGDKEIVLRDAQAKEHRVATAEVDTVTPQRQSLMPEQLLRDLTAQQAADLVDYLASLKK
jgi:putative heme-binding domain-containing protein